MGQVKNVKIVYRRLKSWARFVTFVTSGNKCQNNMLLKMKTKKENNMKANKQSYY